MAEHFVFSSILIVCVLFLSAVFGSRKYPCLKYALWLPVAVVLMIPEASAALRFAVTEVLGDVSGKRFSDAASGNAAALTALWAVGMAVFAMIFAVKNLRFYLYLKRHRVRKGIWKKRLVVYEVRELRSPCLFGVFPPAIYLNEINSQEKRREKFILNHEYTHYRHGDHIWSVVRCLCLVLYWYHPLVWVAAGISKRDGELACDAGTLKRIGERNRIPYRSMLISLAQKASDQVAGRLVPGRRLALLDTSTSVAVGLREMQRRIRRIGRRVKQTG